MRPTEADGAHAPATVADGGRNRCWHPKHHAAVCAQVVSARCSSTAPTGCTYRSITPILPTCLPQFRAVADQVYGNQQHHAAVRAEVVQRLQQNPERYCGFVMQAYPAYCDEMSRLGTWGDHVTLQARWQF